MIEILCYGDSNTYGYNPTNGMRYPKDVRWTGRLQSILGDSYHIIEEGCNGRTTVFEDPIDGWKRGLDYLKPCLNTHKPLDVVVMMLGSNDLKNVFHASAQQIADGAETLVKVIKEFTQLKQGFVPKIILIAPPEIGSDIANSPFSVNFDETAIARSKEFKELYEQVAKRNNCIFFNAASYITASKEDSLHLDPSAHGIFAERLSELIREEIDI